MLVPRDPFFQALQGMHGSAFNPNLGGYLFDHLLPGRYEVSAFTVGPGKKYGGRTTVEVEGGKTSEVGLPVQKIEVCFFEYFHIIHRTVCFAVVSARLLQLRRYLGNQKS